MNRTTQQKGTAYRTGKWIVGAALVAAPLLMHVQADAHVMTGAQPDWCSPHGAVVSTSQTNFYSWSCQQETSTIFSRGMFCYPGTPCANALCGGDSVCGHSYSDGALKHGANGGHKAFVDAIHACGYKEGGCRWEFYPEP